MQCWSEHPIIGCGFYQLEKYPLLSAHPHNLLIQVLSETGILGFGLLAYIFYRVIKRINWSRPHRYFIVAAILAMSSDLFFSGVHIYPVTQMVMLWLLLFLFRNPEFTKHNQIVIPPKNIIMTLLPALFYLVISLWFINLLMTTKVFMSEVPFTPPRFWVYGYRL